MRREGRKGGDIRVRGERDRGSLGRRVEWARAVGRASIFPHSPTLRLYIVTLDRSSRSDAFLINVSISEIQDFVVTPVASAFVEKVTMIS